MQAVLDFPLQSSIKKAFLFNFVSNFPMQFNDGCGQVLYIGHSSEKSIR